MRKLASVDAVVKTLVKEGWDSIWNANTSEDNSNDSFGCCSKLDDARGYFLSAFFIAKKFGVSRETVDDILKDYLTKRKATSKTFYLIHLPPESLMLKFAKLGVSKSVVDSLREVVIGWNLKTNQKGGSKNVDRRL